MVLIGQTLQAGQRGAEATRPSVLRFSSSSSQPERKKWTPDAERLISEPRPTSIRKGTRPADARSRLAPWESMALSHGRYVSERAAFRVKARFEAALAAKMSNPPGKGIGLPFSSRRAKRLAVWPGRKARPFIAYGRLVFPAGTVFKIMRT